MNVINAITYLFKSLIFISCFVHAIFIAYDLICPTDTVLRFEQRNLDDIEFPIIFKVCITPGFNISELQEAGYKSIWYYFTGTSKYSENIYGWSGHTENGSTISSAKGEYLFQSFISNECLEIRKRAVVYIKKLFNYINLKYFDGSNKKYYWKKGRPLAKLLQLNHPNNCYDIDIYRLKKNLTGFNQIQINFKKDPRYKVEIILEDRKQSLSRSYKYNKFGNIGPRILIENLTKNHYK